jgi:hypothetical protein
MYVAATSLIEFMWTALIFPRSGCSVCAIVFNWGDSKQSEAFAYSQNTSGDVEIRKRCGGKSG